MERNIRELVVSVLTDKKRFSDSLFRLISTPGLVKNRRQEPIILKKHFL